MRKNVTLSLDMDIWKKYKVWCLTNDKIPSKEVQEFMSEQLKAKVVK